MTNTRRTILTGALAATATVAMPSIVRAQAAPIRIALLTVKTVRLPKAEFRWSRGSRPF